MKEQLKELILKSKLQIYYEKYMFVIGVLGQGVFFFQGIKIFLNRSAKDVSMVGFLLGLISVSSWLLYGIMLKDRPLIVANITAVIGALLVVMGILIYG